MIDIKELEEALSKMQPRQQIYEIVKAEMIKRGRWKNLSRGTPMKKGHDDRRGK